MDKFALAFSVSNLGPKTYQKMLNKFDNSENGWNASKEELEEIGIKFLTYKKFNEFREKFNIDNYLIQLKKNNVCFVPQGDKLYPKGLLDLPDPPIGIFCKGNMSLLKNNFCLGVVGTRKLTEYGRDVTEFIVKGLVENDMCVVSGLALGVDALSHRTAVDNGGATIVVLACGVDCCLPSENYSIFKKIIESNCLIISEYPLSQPPNKGTFLARNRIIAAISSGVLVTEAAANSGSLVTADWGFRLEKKVFAVPGPITSRMSDGSLKLLKNGANLVTNVDDIINQFDGERLGIKVFINKKTHKNLTPHEKKIIKVLELDASTIDEIAKQTNLSITSIFVAISRPELQNMVVNVNGKITSRRPA